MARRSILFVGGRLPTRSETFVYRELFGLRARGAKVLAASVHPPERDLGEARLEALANGVIDIYGAGPARLVRDAVAQFAHRPFKTGATLLAALRDAVMEPDVRWWGRPKVLWQGLAGVALARRVEKEGIRHVHAHMAHVPTTIAMYCARQLGVTFSFTGHAVDIFRLRALLRVKLKRAAFVACISEWHREFYRETAEMPDGSLPIVRCGVDVRKFAPSCDAESGEGGRIMAVGRLVPKKGFDVLIRAVAALRAEGRAVRCVIAGDGPSRRELMRLADELNVQDRVHFLGALDNGEIRRRMEECDLFVLPCRVDASGDRDGIPVVLMEAMACGRCAISGDLPAIRELIADGETGLLVEPGSVGALAGAMRGALDDHEERRRLGEAGRRRVCEEFALDVNVTRLWNALSFVFADDGVDKPCRAADGSDGALPADNMAA